MTAWELHNCEAIEGLARLPDESVNCIVTSPPYWGLRDYGVDGQIGLEPTLAEFLDRLVAVFRECRRVLAKDGTMWVNMGDAYWSNPTRGASGPDNRGNNKGGYDRRKRGLGDGFKDKSLMGQPWRLALALQDDGWFLRSEIIWSKPSAMPESAKDRPTKSHETIFLFAKSKRYWYDALAIAEPCVEAGCPRDQPMKSFGGWATGPGSHCVIEHNMPGSYKGSRHGRKDGPGQDRRSGTPTGGSDMRNARTVWQIATTPYSKAHFATFPPELPRRCIAAGCPPGGVVLDPFAGSGTTLAVALSLGRRAIGIELNPEYCDLIRDRVIHTDIPLFGLEDSA